jgi:hypothetical protein
MVIPIILRSLVYRAANSSTLSLEAGAGSAVSAEAATTTRARRHVFVPIPIPGALAPLALRIVTRLLAFTAAERLGAKRVAAEHGSKPRLSAMAAMRRRGTRT